MIISGIAGFIASAVTAELYSPYTENDLLSSLATVLTGIPISNLSFVILFHIENRGMYVDASNCKINYKILREVCKKLGVAWSIFEIVNNVSRFIILYHLFSTDVDPSDASILSSLVASIYKSCFEAIQNFPNRKYFFRLFIQGSSKRPSEVAERSDLDSEGNS